MATANEVIREFLAAGGNPQDVGGLINLTGSSSNYANWNAADYVKEITRARTPQELAQTRADEGVWNNMFMNSPVYNGGGANTYQIQQQQPTQQYPYLLNNSVNTNAARNGTTTNTPYSPVPGGRQINGVKEQTTSSVTPQVNTQSVTQKPVLRENQLSSSGGPQYSMAQRTEGLNQSIPGMGGGDGYLGRVSGERTGTTSATGNPYSAQYPWSNWKLWKQ